MAVCVFALPFPTLPFCFRSCLRHLKSISTRTPFAHMFDSLSSAEGCKPKKKKKKKKTHGCYAPGVWRGEAAASRSLSDSAVVCHISVDVANCLHPPGSSAVSLNLTSDFCAQAETYWMKEKLGAWFSAAVLNESPSWGNWGHLQRSGEVFRQKLPPVVVRASDYDAFWIFQLEHLGVPQEEMEDVAPLLSLMPPWPTSAQAEYMTFIIPFLLSEYCVC